MIALQSPLRFITQRIRFYQDYKLISRQLNNSSQQRFIMNWRDKKPCLDDNTATTGFDRQYIYFPAWAARIVAKIQPKYHVDISSTIAFATLVSAFVPIKFYDYRVAPLNLSQLTSGKADLLKLPFASDSIDSLSCMHVVEHVGLGRYGDPLDVDADLQAIGELKRVLAKNGDLLFVVPIGGEQRIAYNAHRIYSYDNIIEYFKDLQLKEFALIPDDSKQGDLVINATKRLSDKQQYGCGCFWFKKANR